MDVEITELESIDATRVDGVGTPANGIPFLMMKSVAGGDVEKDWGAWDAAHGGKGKKDDSKADASAAVERAKQTIADHKAGKKVSAADLKNAHDVHEAHLAHLKEEEAKGGGKAADGKAKAARPAVARAAASSKKSTDQEDDMDDDVTKGSRDCPKCSKNYDADHQGSKCENCGTDLPDAPAAKAAGEIADSVADVDTVTKETGSLIAKAVEDAIAKAVAPLQERVKALDAELAKVKAAPVPGGMVLSRNVQVKQAGAVANEDHLAKAAYYREMAETVTDRPTADGYRKLAREHQEKAVTITS